MKIIFNRIILATALLLTVQLANAQYFGRNKPRYRGFEFEVVKTPHFDIYHYLENKELASALSADAEKWYGLHQRIFQDTVLKNNPVLFYSNHADFQQTNAISGMIGTGTGGVTEALKNRVVMPIATSNQQTDHVLGHEMVHAFQYSLVLNGDSTNLNSLGNLPLWMVEGLAEYMSKGRTDAHTAMWMRDAVLHGDVPRLRDLSRPQYFPYRWGQVFWAFVAGWRGDDIIRPLFESTAKYGFEAACLEVLQIPSDTLSRLWESTLKTHFGGFLADRKERFIGKKILSKENAGHLNISPSLNPNGRYVVFFSEKDLFTLDLYLADARNGKIIRKLATTLRDGHIDDFSFIESAGTWSPKGDRFAFAGVSQGANVLIVKNVENGRTVDEIRLKEVPAFSNPAWSPDGKSIVVAGLVDGQVDLYLVDVKSKKSTRLTNDRFSEMHPAWSGDGQKLVFSTDARSFTGNSPSTKLTFNLAVMNMTTQQVRSIDLFSGADNLNPVLDKQGDIIFLSNRDGFRNLYRYVDSTGKVLQMTDFLTGVSGITEYAPAITIGGQRDRMLFTHFYKGDYQIYEAEPAEFLSREVEPTAVNMTAAELPRINRRSTDIIEAGLANPGAAIEAPASSAFAEARYKPKFKLDFVTGGGGVGIGSNAIGNNTLLAGGVTMLFSDILGDHQLITTLAMNGEIYDAGGQVAYLNQKKRIGWGLGGSHIPYSSATFPLFYQDVVNVNGGLIPALRQTYKIQRIFEDRFDVFAQYPLSVTKRFEVGSSFAYYSSRIDSIDIYYESDPSYQFIGQFLGQERTKVGGFPGFKIISLNGAFVGDNSYFGVASPLQGYRYRFGGDVNFGDYQFYGITADYRIYKYLKPITLAFRLTHFGRYGRDSDRLFPQYLGNPWFVRGYQQNFVNENSTANDLYIDQLLGSKIGLTGFEVRLPFTGPERLSLLKSSFLLTELALFIDGGIAWFFEEQFQDDVIRPDPDTGELYLYRKAKPVFSTGASLRINLFGALVLEPYVARPLQPETKWLFGLNIVPGW